MSASIEKNSDNIFEVKGDITFSTVSDLLEQGNRLLLDASEITFDLAGVKHSDSAGLALLTEWTRFAESNKRPIVFVNMPAQMLAIAKATGMDTILSIK